MKCPFASDEDGWVGYDDNYEDVDEGTFEDLDDE